MSLLQLLQDFSFFVTSISVLWQQGTDTHWGTDICSMCRQSFLIGSDHLDSHHGLGLDQ